MSDYDNLSAANAAIAMLRAERDLALDAVLQDQHHAEALQAENTELRAFAEWIAAMNPTSGKVTFAMRVEMQERARQALASHTGDTADAG